MRRRGESGFSLTEAGHHSSQRPHSMQVERASRSFQLNSSSLPTPKGAAGSNPPEKEAGDAEEKEGRHGDGVGWLVEQATGRPDVAPDDSPDYADHEHQA